MLLRLRYTDFYPLVMVNLQKCWILQFAQCNSIAAFIRLYRRHYAKEAGYYLLLLLPVNWTSCLKSVACMWFNNKTSLKCLWHLLCVVKGPHIWKHLMISGVFTLVVLVQCVCTLIFPLRTAAPSSASLNTYRSMLYSLPPRRLKPKPLLSRSRSTE